VTFAPEQEDAMTVPQDGPEKKSTVEARQGVTGHNVRYVLFTGLGLAIVAGIILYFAVGHSGVMP
jgi:hypothetical protein